MCGIAGIYAFSGGSADGALLAAMSERLRHRGPDGDGVHLDGTIGLAHRRLSIIDLTDAAAQPMQNEDESLWLVFNGEIYNYIELRGELERAGHVFRSRTDSEVILHAYEEWGHGCLSRFNGMWAFLLWDGKKEELFCARDRFGIKPLYYAVSTGSFLAASEIKALLACPGVGTEPNDAALLTFLAYGVLDHTEQTMFDGVRQIPPAHFLVVGRNGAGTAIRYWDCRVNPDHAGSPGDRDEHAARLLALLRDSVRIELRSDVPVGTCLSGGIDSSTLAVLIGERIRLEGVPSVGERQNTFSACYDDPRFDECRFVDIAAAATGASGHRTHPEPRELEDDIAHLVRIQDEPFSSLSIYAQYRVMKLAREHVKVVLDGQGADELLGGYLAYQASYVRGLVRRLRLFSAIREIAGSARHHGGFFRDAASQVRVRATRRALLRMDPVPVQRYRGSLDRVLHAEIVSTNLPALLHWEDRNSMAFSIEARVPYLDHRLVEFTAGLPLDEKIRGGVTKVVLRRAIRGLVPDAIRCRMDKMGFVAPEEVWMKEELRPFVLGIFASPSFRGRKYWDADRVAANYRGFLEGRAAYSSEIWRFVSAELWLREFFDARNGASWTDR